MEKLKKIGRHILVRERERFALEKLNNEKEVGGFIKKTFRKLTLVIRILAPAGACLVSMLSKHCLPKTRHVPASQFSTFKYICALKQLIRLAAQTTNR